MSVNGLPRNDHKVKGKHRVETSITCAKRTNGGSIVCLDLYQARHQFCCRNVGHVSNKSRFRSLESCKESIEILARNEGSLAHLQEI